jgi:hypothetical protein
MTPTPPATPGAESLDEKMVEEARRAYETEWKLAEPNQQVSDLHVGSLRAALRVAVTATRREDESEMLKEIVRGCDRCCALYGLRRA